jgi:hypothetical protein
MATLGSAMPRFYIDFRGHFGTREDPLGTELSDISAARNEALRLAGELVQSWSGMLPTYYDEIIVEVREENFSPVIVISYSEFAVYLDQSRAET